MNVFYVRDGNNVAYFNLVSDVVSFLEKVVVLKLKMSRAQWMEHIVDLGHGSDDKNGKCFTESMAEQVEIGVVQKDGKHVRCSIHEATSFKDSAYGD